jgi:predicted nuclease of predicted toxin-antitoxin system
VKFVVDAQLPRRLAHLLISAGHDAIHTFDLPQANRTSDGQIETLTDNEQRVVITKDNDFVASFWLRGRPEKLLLISNRKYFQRRIVRIN